MADLFDDHRLGAAWDEMLAGLDRPRAPYHAVHGTLQRLTGEELGLRARTPWPDLSWIRGSRSISRVRSALSRSTSSRE